MTQDISFDPFLLELIRSKEEWEALGQRLMRELFASEERLPFPQRAHPALSIVLVFYNKAHLSLLCLLGILKTVEAPYEVVIVDNHSSDETAAVLSRCENVTVLRNGANNGFGPACMQAVGAARGTYLLFLNNDAVLEHDSVEAALRNFSDARVGAVGGKILLSDGNLQEAGSILWNAGSALGYGRGDYPHAARYSFRRPVDYCSGAFLFTPRELFLSLGGFDPAFAPAYYEDTDYCMKVWKAGLQVLYDPNAVIRHYESASSGSNEAARPAMAEKQTVFAARWCDQLASHLPPAGENIVRARIASAWRGLRILYLDDRVPHRGLGSGYTRSNDVLRELAALGHQITCVPVAFRLDSLDEEYRDIDRSVELYDIALGIEQLFAEYVPTADVIWVSRPSNFAWFLDEAVKRCSVRAKLVFDAEAIFADRDRGALAATGRAIPDRVFEARLRREFALAEAADAVVVVSQSDQTRMRLAGIGNVHVLGHQLSPMPTPKSFSERSNFLFVGAIANANAPNADAIRHFCEAIWPRVHQETGADLIVAGLGTDEFLAHLKSENIHVLGRVDDVRSLYADARIVGNATRFAAGIPFKAHEAAAHGVPMIVSALICEQLNWQAGVDLLVAGNAADFAAACMRLYSNPDLWRKLRTNALTRVICELDRDTFAAAVKATLESLNGC